MIRDRGGVVTPASAYSAAAAEFLMRKIWNTILKGLVALLPVGLTIYLVYWLALAAERLFAPAIKLIVPAGVYWPGLGLFAGLAALYVAGLAVNTYAVRSALRSATACSAHPGRQDDLRRDPRLHALLPSSGHDSDLKRVVLVPFGSGKIIGFVTAESGRRRPGGRGRRRRRCVPADELHGGRLHRFLPRELLEPTSLSIEAGMRLALMGGVQGAHPPGVAPTRRA